MLVAALFPDYKKIDLLTTLESMVLVFGLLKVPLPRMMLAALSSRAKKQLMPLIAFLVKQASD
jgi:hypothetical protein